MEGIPFQAGPLSGDIEKTGIEVGVVSNQYGPVAMICFHREPDDTEELSEGDGLGQRATQGVLRIDPGELQRRGVQICPLEGFNVATVGGLDNELSLFVHGQLGDRHFQNSVGLAVESPGFDVDDDREKTAEPISHE